MFGDFLLGGMGSEYTHTWIMDASEVRITENSYYLNIMSTYNPQTGG